MSWVPIVELVTVCERMAATNRALFEQLGPWVVDEPDPKAQQWFAVACHRHAWHAELWERRRPSIAQPIRVSWAGPTGTSHPAETGRDRVAWYSNRLAALKHDLAELEGRLDPVLDPSTARVITLVRADLDDLQTAAPE